MSWFGFRADANATIVSNPMTPDGPVNDSATHSIVDFPVPWVSRIQTPIMRPKVSSMWGNEIPDTYGGPWG